MTRGLLIISLLSYLTACFLPLFNEEDFIGADALVRGWLGILGSPVIFLAWLANLAWLTGFLFSFRNKERGLYFSIAAIILGFFFLLVKEIPIDEGGSYSQVSPGIAFYFWMLSFIILAISNFIEYKKSQAKA